MRLPQMSPLFGAFWQQSIKMGRIPCGAKPVGCIAFTRVLLRVAGKDHGKLCGVPCRWQVNQPLPRAMQRDTPD